VSTDGTDAIIARGDLLQVLVELGKELDRYSAQSPFGGRLRLRASERPACLARIAALQDALDSRIHLQSATSIRRTLRVRPDEVTPVETMRVLAVVAVRQLVTGRLPLGVGATARVAGLDSTAETLEARQAIRRMIAWGVLSYSDGNCGDGDIRLSRRAVRGLSAGGLDIVWTAETLKRDLERGTVDDQVRAMQRAAVERERELGNASLAQTPTLPSAGSLQSSATARQIFESLRRSVIGIDQPLRRFSLQMAMHLRRVYVARSGQRPTVPPVVTLLLGPSGAGKTFACERFCAMANLPSAIGNLAEVTCQGYVGMSLDDLFLDLFAKGAKAEEASYGLMVFDEADKRRTNDRRGDADISGSAVQAELLKVVEGTLLQIGGRRGMDSRQHLETHGMGFCLAGAFERLLEDIAKGGRRGSLGFGHGDASAGVGPDLRERLKDYFIPELVNRLTSIIVFPAPTAEQVVQMIAAPVGIAAAVNGFLSSFGLTMSLDAKAVAAVAGWAVDSKTLARGARSLLTQLAEEAVYEERSGQIAVGEAEVRRAINGMKAGAALG
jgi:ATP-dependent Clp protease ATP-binding subunit ClpX